MNPPDLHVASFLAFLGLSAVVIATPGPDTALTVRNTVLGGRRAGAFTAAGVSAGQIIWALATSVGLVAVLLASEPVFHALKLLGAAYLLYLGAQSLLAAFRGWPRPDPARGADDRLGAVSAFAQGVANNLANPKMAVFFVSVLPQFAAAERGMLSALLGLGLVFSVLTFAWLTLYAVVVARAGRLFRGSRVARLIEGIAGAALIGLGLKVAFEKR
jgi:threonine/homoserine/homoserine lactone efflux protein